MISLPSHTTGNLCNVFAAMILLVVRIVLQMDELGINPEQWSLSAIIEGYLVC